MKNKIIKQIPNIITLSRIITIIIGFILFIKGYYFTSIMLYVYGAISDFLDGYLARRLNAYSKLGKYLDAISDKLYSFSTMVLLIIYSSRFIIIPLVLEMVISCINYFSVHRNKTVYTERVGKYKMTLEFLMIILSLISIKINYFIYLFYIILVLTIYFQIQCIFAYINQLNGKVNKNVNKSIFKEFIYYLVNPIKLIR